ncbi:MAG: hypothetical protein JNJ54_25955 [Myxococcaceae bacterium]|nr:hypothetical protein [Myxococcaceae bacterium]
MSDDIETKKAVRRDERGRIIEGSLNPTGRPKTSPELVEAFRELTPRSVAVLDKAMEDYLEGRGDAATAIRAAEVSLNRAWGKPTERVALLHHELTGLPDDSGLIELMKRMAGDEGGGPH